MLRLYSGTWTLKWPDRAPLVGSPKGDLAAPNASKRTRREAVEDSVDVDGRKQCYVALAGT